MLGGGALEHLQYFFSILTTSNPSVSLYNAKAALFVFRTCKLTCDALKATFMACSAEPKSAYSLPIASASDTYGTVASASAPALVADNSAKQR